ncbi:MAG: YlxR family protein [Clostridia bacterium]|nr:YlxR family protein [Clostridia bacterium]
MGCNTKKDKKDLIRIVKNNKNEITIDKTGKQEGRGAYICNSVQCLEKVIKSKRLERSLDIKISEEIYSNLKKIIDGGEFIG